MKVSTLTPDCVLKLIDSPEEEKGKPQYLQAFEIKISKDPQCRVTMKLSDGVHFIRAVAMKVEVKDFEIIELVKFRVTELKSNKILIADFLRIAFTGLSGFIGSPVEWNKESPQDSAFVPVIPHTAKCLLIVKEDPPSKSKKSIPSSIMDSKAPTLVQFSQPNNKNEKQLVEQPIKALGLYSYDWKLKVRLTKKGELKKFIQQKDGSPGVVLQMELVDQENTRIGAAVFGEPAKALNNYLMEGKCYYLSRGSIKPANRRYSEVDNEYTLLLDKSSRFEECEEDPALPRGSETFTNLRDVQNAAVGTFVDVLGVARNISDLMIMKGRSPEDIKKRTLILFDESSASVPVTLWREFAEKEITENSIVAFRKLRVGDYNGKLLNSYTQTEIAISPQHSRVSQLQEWSNRNPAQGPAVSIGRNPSMMLAEIWSSNNQIDPQGKYYSVSGIVSAIAFDRGFYYLACSVCRRKVTSGICDRCNENCGTKAAYMFTLCLTDGTGSIWASVLGDTGNSFVTRSAEEMKHLQDCDDEQYKLEFDAARTKNHGFLIKARKVILGEKETLQFQLLRVFKQNFKMENKQILKKLEKYEKRFC